MSTGPITIYFDSSQGELDVDVFPSGELAIETRIVGTGEQTTFCLTPGQAVELMDFLKRELQYE